MRRRRDGNGKTAIYRNAPLETHELHGDLALIVIHGDYAVEVVFGAQKIVSAEKGPFASIP